MRPWAAIPKMNSTRARSYFRCRVPSRDPRRCVICLFCPAGVFEVRSVHMWSGRTSKTPARQKQANHASARVSREHATAKVRAHPWAVHFWYGCPCAAPCFPTTFKAVQNKVPNPCKLYVCVLLSKLHAMFVRNRFRSRHDFVKLLRSACVLQHGAWSLPCCLLHRHVP